jgi:hypothetical protein
LSPSPRRPSVRQVDYTLLGLRVAFEGAREVFQRLQAAVEADEEINCLSLTPAGRQLYAEVLPAHEAFIVARLSVLSPAEHGQLLAL